MTHAPLRAAAAAASARPVLGVGCAGGCQPEALEALARTTLAAGGVAPESVGAVATVAARTTHPAVVALGRTLGVPVYGFAAALLETQTPHLSRASARVFQAVGCHGVAEGAALAGAGPGARLLVPKQTGGLATCALALAGVSSDCKEVS